MPIPADKLRRQLALLLLRRQPMPPSFRALLLTLLLLLPLHLLPLIPPNLEAEGWWGRAKRLE